MAPTLRIRHAVEADTEAVLDGIEWLFPSPGSTPSGWNRADAAHRVRRVMASERSAVLLAETGGAVIGVCSAYLDIESIRFGPRCWVEDLAVSPEHRSQGVGRALLDAAKQWAREHGCTHLELDSGEARTEAHRFYERERPTHRSLCFGWNFD